MFFPGDGDRAPNTGHGKSYQRGGSKSHASNPKSFDTTGENLKHRGLISDVIHLIKGLGRPAAVIAGGCQRVFPGRTLLRMFCWSVLCSSCVWRASALPIELTSASTLPGGTTAMELRVASDASFGRLPLSFEPVDGSGAEFICRGVGYAMRLSPTEAAFSLQRSRADKSPAVNGGKLRALVRESSAASQATMQVRLIGADNAARAVGEGILPTRVNYFIGNDPARWRTNVRTFGKVRYRDVYSGVDLVYYGNQRQLEYDFELAPGANPERIALNFQGADSVGIDANGDLLARIGETAVRQRKPIVYQNVNGEHREIEGRYVLRSSNNTNAARGERSVGFEIGAYDKTRPLVIDPVLVYSTFLGGLGFDRAWDIAVDGSGSAYVVGDTVSTNFPTSGAMFGTNNGGVSDVFVAKLDPSGTNLAYSTYLGGNGNDVGFGIALDGGGNVYVTGLTASTNFPVTANAFSTNLHSAPYFGFYTNDAFVAKLDATGTSLLYSSYLGGSNADVGTSITVDGGGNVYVAGETESVDFPTNAVSPPFGGVHDAFIVKLTATDTNLIYATYLGGTGDDRALSVAADSAGNAVVVGVTTSTDFPITAGAIQTNYFAGLYDIFVTKLSPDGASRLFSTYLGDYGDDEAARVALDVSANIYVTGLTTSTNFPVLTNGFPGASVLYPTNGGSRDAFVIKLDASGTNVIYWTFLGGVLDDEGWSIVADTNGSAYVVGLTSSTNFPTADAFQASLNGLTNDAFILKLNPTGTAIDFSTYFGGVDADNGFGIALDSGGNVYISGTTISTNLPVYPATNGLQTVNGGGGGDAFVAKLFPGNAELRAQLSGSDEVTVFWPLGLPDFELQFTDVLDGTNTPWSALTNSPIPTGGDNAITFTNVNGNAFFRLRRTR